ncbi:unnamed protein product [Clonostachys byssicola]|uniref:Protein kinase domain-containing protein n=1 Tax=Clonostachys byssicola TaxID=160290 RepID=A0A9N9URJ0_9HYPO|nr:unnamed protein product [Clonostachys byssicola]
MAMAATEAAFHFLDNFQKHRAELAIKYTPTQFGRFSTLIKMALKDHEWQQDGGPNETGEGYSRKDTLAHRDEWQQLGRGFEGRVFKYQGNVIKVFSSERTPLRNCMPGTEPRLRWPTEIPASLILGGPANEPKRENRSGFLSVVDYYLSPSTGNQAREWHLVTPFLPLGNLGKLAYHLRRSDISYTVRELDIVFRPSIERLLEVLGGMHMDSGLCHDDVKLDNIFLGSSQPILDTSKLEAGSATEWLLGDLGNVRERDHPYHVSNLWTLSGNLPDCRANDVLRLLKVYMTFLRESMVEPAIFDEEFFQDSQPWSRLFWLIWEDAQKGRGLSASSALELSRKSAHRPTDKPRENAYIDRQPREWWDFLWRMIAGNSVARHWAVKKTLRISAGDAVARKWGLVLLLSVPRGSCDVDTL